MIDTVPQAMKGRLTKKKSLNAEGQNLKKMDDQREKESPQKD